MSLRGTFEGLPADRVYDGVTRRSFSSDRATVTTYAFAPSATFPRHRHAQEQITLIQTGEVEMTIGDRVEHLSAGDWSVIEPELEHGITAGQGGATVMAILVPRREAADAYTVVS
jgi:quercetin dioxygenase-like cupin family protein